MVIGGVLGCEPQRGGAQGKLEVSLAALSTTHSISHPRLDLGCSRAER
jgi:hypothetical protein